MLEAVGDGTRPVASLLRQSNVPIALLAVLRARRTFAPIATDYPNARRLRVLHALQPGCLLVDNDTAGLAHDYPCPIVNMDTATVLESDRAPNAGPGRAVPSVVIFTSGSTGEPVGVLHSEDNLLRIAERSVRSLQIAPSDRLSMLTRGVHISGMTDIVRSFVSGATLVPSDIAAVGVDMAVDTIRKAGVTILHCTPSLARTLFSAVNDSNCYRSLRTIHLGGEPLPAAVVELCRRRLPAGAVVINQLGCTELSGYCQAFLSSDTVIPHALVPAGFPVDGVCVRILDEHGRPAANGEIGSIEVAGDGLALGYWKIQSELQQHSRKRAPASLDAS
jgi:non-ribosomal peptide synthetase component F